MGLSGNELYSMNVNPAISGGEVTSEFTMTDPSRWYTIGNPLSQTFSSEDNLSMILAPVKYGYLNNTKTYPEFVLACADGDTVDLYTFNNCDVDWEAGTTTVYYLGSIPNAVDISCLHTVDEVNTGLENRGKSDEQGDEPSGKVPDPIETDAKVRAQIKLEDGSTAWVEIPLNDVENPIFLTDKSTDAPFLTGGGLGAGGFIYGSNIEFGEKEDGALYKLDPKQNYAQVATTENWPWQYAPMGVAATPDGEFETMLTYGTPDEQSGVRSLLFLAEKNHDSVPSADYGLTDLATRLSGITYLKQLNGDYRFIGIDTSSVVSYMDANAPVVDGYISNPDDIKVVKFEMTVLSSLASTPFSKIFESPDDLSMQIVSVQGYGASSYETIVAYTGDGTADIYYFNNFEKTPKTSCIPSMAS